MGLLTSAPNLSGEALLGLKPFKEVLYSTQLNFFFRLLNQGNNRWSKDAFLSNIRNGWKSPYIGYIAKIMKEVNMWRAPVSLKHIEIVTGHYFMRQLNLKIASLNLPVLQTQKTRCRAKHMNESDESKVISCWLIGNLE